MKYCLVFWFRCVAVACSVAALGCSAAYSAFPSIDPRSPNQKAADQASKCDGGAPQEWDLGTGSLEDIADHEPQFYSYEPNQGTAANRARVIRLKNAPLPKGIRLKPRSISGHQLVEFEGPPSSPDSVVDFSSSQRGSGILLSPASCPHVVVNEQCIEDQFVTEVTVQGTLPCFKGVSGEMQIEGPGLPSDATIKPGIVFWGGKSAGGFFTINWRTQMIFSGPVGIDNFPHATPALLSILIEEADDTTAFQAFKQLDPQWHTQEVLKEIEKKRIARMEQKLSSSRDILSELKFISASPDFPGHATVLEMVNQRLMDDFEQNLQADPTEIGYWKGIVLLTKILAVENVDTSEFVPKYGAFLTGGHFGGQPSDSQKAEDEFIRRWPQSEWAKQLLDDRKKAADEAQARANVARKEQEAEEKREATAERVKCSARCEHKCMAGIYSDKALCRAGCRNYECDQNECVGACQIDCARGYKAGQPGCVSACQKGRCGG